MTNWNPSHRHPISQMKMGNGRSFFERARKKITHTFIKTICNRNQNNPREMSELCRKLKQRRSLLFQYPGKN